MYSDQSLNTLHIYIYVFYPLLLVAPANLIYI